MPLKKSFTSFSLKVHLSSSMELGVLTLGIEGIIRRTKAGNLANSDRESFKEMKMGSIFSAWIIKFKHSFTMPCSSSYFESLIVVIRSR